MTKEERDAEMLGGIPLFRSKHTNWYVVTKEPTTKFASVVATAAKVTHIAYPVDVARARERVVEAARRVDAGAPESLLERLELSIALAGLDAAEGGAGT